LIFSRRWLEGELQQVKQVILRDTLNNIYYTELWICYSNRCITLELSNFATTLFAHSHQLEKDTASSITLPFAYKVLYFPAMDVIQDICPISLIRDGDELYCAILAISDHEGLFVYFMEKHNQKSSFDGTLLSPYGQIIEAGSHVTSKLTSFVFSLAKNVLNADSLSYSTRLLHSDQSKENEEITMKLLFHWQDPGRAYLRLMEGLNYTILTDSLGHYSIFHNQDGLIIRMIRERRISRCMWVLGKPNLLAIYRPHENCIYLFQMPFEKEPQSILQLSISDEHIPLRILAQADDSYIVIILDLTLPELPKLNVYHVRLNITRI
jgi:hypothetical protein